MFGYKQIEFILWIILLSIGLTNPMDYAKQKLSDYHFFNDPLKNQSPKSNVFPYQISTPLFTDYAKKLRYMVLPEGQKMSYVNPEKFDFPIGTIFVKTFYYPHDFNNLENDKNFTRSYPKSNRYDFLAKKGDILILKSSVYIIKYFSEVSIKPIG